jgi:hypothetical protein
MTQISIHAPAPVAIPRAAPIAAEWFASLLEVMHLVRRAQNERNQASRRRAEAARLRRYAQEVSTYDPRFASDLFAAADRHDRED